MLGFGVAGIERIQRRTVGTLLAGQSLASMGFYAGIAIATVAAARLTRPELIGLAPAAAILGGAVFSVPLSRYMSVAGRRRGLILGYVIATVGAAVVTAALAGESFALLVVGFFLFGAASTCGHLARYAAADAFEQPRRGTAIAFVVWGATVGAFVGPNLLGPTGVVAETFGLPPYAGSFLLSVVVFTTTTLVLFMFLRPDPLEIAKQLAERDPEPVPDADTEVSALRLPHVRIAFAVLLTSYLTMVMVMSMTPVHLDDHHHSLSVIGLVISFHLAGMFALSPVTGKLTDRFGPVPVMVVGLGTLAVATTLAALADPNTRLGLLVALLILGIGWNFAFVASSTLLTTGLGTQQRVRVQGLGDLVTGVGAAFASTIAGVLLGVGGYVMLAVVATVAALVMLVIVAGTRRIVAQHA